MGRPKKEYDFLRQIDNLYIRNCPSCGNEIKHSSKIGAINCHNQKRKCYSCGNSQKEKPSNEERQIQINKQSKRMKEIRKISPPWNKGLTKENSEILRVMGESHNGHKHTEETKKLISKTSKDRWNSGFYDNIFNTPPEFFKYQSKVHKLTRKVAHLIEGYDKKKQGKCGVEGAYQIDHIVSIKYGFENNMEPEKIADIQNLRFIPWEENLKRRSKVYVKKSNI